LGLMRECIGHSKLHWRKKWKRLSCERLEGSPKNDRIIDEWKELHRSHSQLFSRNKYIHHEIGTY
jgi:hypothetical protein